MPWYNALGWRNNPFDYRPSAEFFVFDDLSNEVVKHIESNSVISTYGIAGMGKTSLLHYLDQTLSKDKYITLYIDFRETSTKEELENLLRRNIMSRTNFIGKLFKAISKEDTSYVDDIKKVLNNKKMVIFLDEAGLLKDEKIANILATIKDRVDCSIVSTSILPLSSYEIYKGSFREGRVAREIAFPIPKNESLKRMINGRIESVGGNKIFPFSEDALDYLTKISGNIPRELLINCQNASTLYVDEKYEREITQADLEHLLTGKTIGEHEDENIKRIYENLSENQKVIIKALVQPKTAQELEKELQISYGSITKEIGRLMLQTDTDMMFRKGLRNPVCTKTMNRPYKFILSKKWRLLFTQE